MPRDVELFVLLRNRFYKEAAPGIWNPSVDLCLKPDQVVVKVEVPGMEPKDVQVSVFNSILRIQGIKPEPQAVEELVGYLCVERSYGKFRREIPLNWVVDLSRVQAQLTNGVLTIILPRSEDRRGREFFITVK